MGAFAHHAIVVIGMARTDLENSQFVDIEDAHEAARKAGCLVTGVVEAPLNGYASFMVTPDGSKEGWDESDAGDGERDRFVEWLNGPGLHWFKWAEVVMSEADGDSVSRSWWETRDR